MAWSPLAHLAVITHFIVFLLLLLVSLSLPILKTLYLAQLKTTPSVSQPPTSIATELRFGIWGFCAASALNKPTFFTNDGKCSPTALGYDIDPAVLALTGQAALAGRVVQILTGILVLHPIACGLSLIALLLAIGGIWKRWSSILGLITAIVSALLTTIVLVIDYVLIGEVRSNVGPLSGLDVEVSYGNCVWLVLVAAILLWVGIVFESMRVCNCCGFGRRREW
ncbi:actin cortical patch SUR7/pH-response regulator pali [Hysterangium stoloniferum]|nr:actin cortical patch SUR7/pH-response regulator pali [Hysterangium stoloniferum]